MDFLAVYGLGPVIAAVMGLGTRCDGKQIEASYTIPGQERN
jgi:hypothetical protein